MHAQFRMVYMSTKHLPQALVRFARSPKGEGMILIGPEALMAVCPIVHASGLLHGPGKSVPGHSIFFPTARSYEIMQRQEQGEQRRLQQQEHMRDTSDASAGKSRKTLPQEQRQQRQQLKQIQPKAQAFTVTQPKMWRMGLRCRFAHASCYSPGQALRFTKSLWGPRAAC